MSTGEVIQDFPLFPLPMVAFPHARFPLQIFEPRYLDLVKLCLSEDRCFGVVTAIRPAGGKSASGYTGEQESRYQPKIKPVGVQVKIIDFNQQSNGLLGILCQGVERFEIKASYLAKTNLLQAEIQPKAEDDSRPIPAEYDGLLAVLNLLIQHPYTQSLGYGDDGEDSGDGGFDLSKPPSPGQKSMCAGELSWHLAHLLPIPTDLKYALLEDDNVLSRLQQIAGIVSRMQRRGRST